MNTSIPSDIAPSVYNTIDLVSISILAAYSRKGFAMQDDKPITEDQIDPRSTLGEVVNAMSRTIAERSAAPNELLSFDEVIGYIADAIENETDVQLRHWSSWKNRTIEHFTKRINSMMIRNEQTAGRIDEEAVEDLTGTLCDFNAFGVLEEDSLREELKNEYGLEKHEILFSLLPVFDHYYLSLSDGDFYDVEEKLSPENACEYLTDKLASRTMNDGQVYYGKMHPATHRYITRNTIFESIRDDKRDERLDFPVEHVTGSGGRLTFPTMTRVEKHPEENHRFVVAVDGAHDQTFLYGDFDSLIDDGWILSGLDPMHELFGA